MHITSDMSGLDLLVNKSLDDERAMNDNLIEKLAYRHAISNTIYRRKVMNIFLKSKNKINYKQLAKSIIGDTRKIRATLCMFLAKGLILRSGTGRRGSEYKYELSEDIKEHDFLIHEDEFKVIDSLILIKSKYPHETPILD